MRNKKVFLAISAILLFVLPAPAQTNRSFKKGYRGTVELGFGAVNGKMQNGFIKSNLEVSPADHEQPGEMVRLSTVHGYSFGNGVFIGGGFGWDFELIDNAQYASIFVNTKYNLKDASASPFVEGRAGYSFCTNGPKYDTGGLFVNAAVGVDFGRFTTRMGYEFCPIKQNYRTSVGLDRKFYSMNQFFLSLAFNF